MSMLLLNDIFERTWGGRGGPATTDGVLDRCRSLPPRGRIRTSSSWLRLIGTSSGNCSSSGFDFCYDKRLYDRLEHEKAESVRLHLCADLGYQKKLLRFLENHDEPRAAATFSPPKERAAAVAIASLPGAQALP